MADPAPNGEAGKNPFSSLVALYLVAKDPVSGVLVKLAGEGELDEETLRVSTTFRNTPQVPFEDLKVDLFGGPRASVSTPARCGALRDRRGVHAVVGDGPGERAEPAEDSRSARASAAAPCPAGGRCRSPRGSRAYSTNPQAGAFTGFQLELTQAGRRSGALGRVDASAAGGRGDALERRTVLGSAGRGELRVRRTAKSGMRRRSPGWAQNRSCRKAGGCSSRAPTAARRSAWRS